MIRKTGVAGGWEEYSRVPTVSTLLYDFDIESARLKSMHRGYIEKVLAPVIMRKGILKPWSIAIIGHSSASGKASYNKELSLRRAKAVAQYLRLHTPLHTLRIKTTGAGEKYAKGWENRLDRAVHVKAVPSGKGIEPDDEPPPFEDKPLPPQVGEAQLFHLRFLKISKVGAYFLGKVNIVVEITDRYKQRPHRYLFQGEELSGGLGPFDVQAGQTTKPSEYHPFWTPPGGTQLLSPRDFNGEAKIIKGMFVTESFNFGKKRGSSDFRYRVKPLKWSDPGFMNWDLLGSIQGHMGSTTIDLPDF